MRLTDQRCVPCEGGAAALTPEAADALGAETPDWVRIEGRIQREWTLKDFASVLDFVRDIGDLAEDEGHHPDIHMTNYRVLRIELTTHAIGGLSDNDYILAAKIDRLWKQHE